MVLAITSLALTLIFSIGSRASQTGFRLGRRALGVADDQVATDTLRALLDGLTIPPERGGGETYAPLVGDARTLTADASLLRPTPCAGAGPAGIVRLSIQPSQNQASQNQASQNQLSQDQLSQDQAPQNQPPQGRMGLFCQAGAAPPVQIVDFGFRGARFSYAPAGLDWSDLVRLEVNPPIAFGLDSSVRTASPRHLLVRVATSDGRFEVIQRVSSGPPPPQRAAGFAIP